MKKLLIAALALGMAAAAPAAPIQPAGVEYDGTGMIIEQNNLVVFKVVLDKGGRVERHNYPDAQADLLFTVLKGKVRVTLNDTEHHELGVGKLMPYKGKDFVQTEALEDAEFTVTIVKAQ